VTAPVKHPVRQPVRHIAQLVVGVVAIAAAVLCWLQVTSLVDVPPVTEGQPASVSVVYDPPLMILSWLLATVGGVLAVLGVAGLRRDRNR
jgi:hypothetical protein